MSAAHSKKTLSLSDFSDFLSALATEGVEVVVIGGCAVGAYANLIGESVFSADLDVLVSRPAIESALDAATKAGAVIHKRPQPRSVPVAVLEWRGMEVNLLMAGAALAPAEVEAQLAREFHLPGPRRTPVLVVDPFQLLRDKVACGRSKDRPHIRILQRFLEEEAVHAFETESEPRRRLAAPRRYLDVLGQAALPGSLARRLIPIAKTGTDLRFLAHRAPSALRAGIVARAQELGLASDLSAFGGTGRRRTDRERTSVAPRRRR